MTEARARAVLIAAAFGLLTILGSGCGGDRTDTAAAGNRGEVAADEYRSYLEENAATFVDWLTRLTEEVEAGHLSSTQSRYASAHVPYGHIEPLAASLGGIDFRRIEKALWVDKTVDGAAPLARALLAEGKALRGGVEKVELRPARIARDLNSSLEGVLASGVTGEKDPYSHIDLVDIAATVEGVEAGFNALEPALIAEDAELAREVEASFADTYVALSDFGFAAREAEQPRPSSPGTSFVLYVERSAAEFDRLGRQIGALAALLSEVPSQVSEDPAS